MKKYILLTIILIMGTIGYSQTLVPAVDLDLIVEPTVEQDIPDEVADTLTDPLFLLSIGDQVNLGVSFRLEDTLNVVSIGVKLGTTDGGSEIIQTTFQFDNSSPGTGLFYSRTLDHVQLGLGVHGFESIMYCEIVLEDANGNTSAVAKYNTLN